MSLDLDVLSPAQRRTVDLVVQGYSNAAVAKVLSLSVITVGNHLALAYEKLGVRSRLELTAKSFNRFAAPPDVVGRDALVLACLTMGLGNKEAAAKLRVSTSTVGTTVRRLCRRFGIPRGDSVKLVRALGLMASEGDAQ